MANLLPAAPGKKSCPAAGIDMTPMVDLGFLLIAFFIFTTSLTAPRVTRLTMHKESTDSSAVAESKVLTAVLAANGRVIVYPGHWENALAGGSIQATDYAVRSGLGALIRRKQQQMGNGRDKLLLLIKPTKESSYQNLVDALDETSINGVDRYAIVEPSEAEQSWANRNSKIKNQNQAP